MGYIYRTYNNNNNISYTAYRPQPIPLKEYTNALLSYSLVQGIKTVPLSQPDENPIQHGNSSSTIHDSLQGPQPLQYIPRYSPSVSSKTAILYTLNRPIFSIQHTILRAFSLTLRAPRRSSRVQNSIISPKSLPS